MRILICVKQVPDLLGEVRPNGDADGYDPSGQTLRMNTYDEFAVEEALRIRESRGDPPGEVVAISAGPT